MKAYDHTKIEKKWQETWAKAKLYETPDKNGGKENYYLLVEFPYPSGNLHVGHWYSFAVPDILARKLRMEGKNVLYPIGFDAFGLPAENAAIKNKVNPRDWTENNIEYMRKQLRSMGASFDWSREVVTCDPAYYKWTQWLFLQLYRSNLVYRKETMVNWCPNDKTVLANEQVVDGKCERCGAEVIQKEMLQWNIKITEYADRLIDDLKDLNWPEAIKESQRNWIGRSEGAEIDFPLDIGGKTQKFVIFHGYEGSPDSPRWKWVKAELEKLGHTVIVPALPHSEDPEEKEWLDTAMNATEYDENTIVVGHSLGAVIGLKLLERLQRPVARFVAVGGFIDTNFKDHSRPFEKRWTWEFDGDKIRKNANSVTVLHDPKDSAVRDEQAAALAALLGTTVVLGQSNDPHFTGDTEPDVLMWLRPTIRVFTTRPDTLFGATYLVLAPEHPWVTLALQHKTVLENNDEVAAYVEKAKKKSELERQTDQKEKTGVKLEGVEALNPATGEKIPLYVADYVLAGYGTGAIMAVPAHDERDYEFAKKFGLPIKDVIEPLDVRKEGIEAVRDGMPFEERNAVMAVVKHWSKDEYLCLKWKILPVKAWVTGGIEEGEEPIEAAKREIREETGYLNAEYVGPLGGRLHVQFYALQKSINRSAHFTPLLFQLKDDSHEEVSEEEKTIQDTQWVPANEVAHFINRSDMLLVWERVRNRSIVYVGDGVLVDSGAFSGLSNVEAKKQMTEEFGRRKTTYKLRDWIVSRQRYWGVPIPMIHCPKCGIVPVPDDQLPVLLPETDDFLPDGKGKSPLAKVSSFINVKCPQCGAGAERETDTLDTFVDSSWYFLRYTDPKNEEEFAKKEKQKEWMPVDLYSGGAEHTTMHLLYSRFWYKALFDRKLVNESEPYLHRENHGLVLGPDGQKMSKSKGNVLDPDELVERVGADTVRMYLGFMGPYTGGNSYPWNPGGVVGLRRFLERVWSAQEFLTDPKKLDDKQYAVIERALHRTIKKVGEDVIEMKFNTAISQLMILLNAIEKEKQIGNEQWQTLLKLLAPFAPHIAEELWHEAGHETSVHLEAWPSFDPKLLQDEEVVIAIQIDGKTRDEITLASGASKDEVERSAREKVAIRLEGKTVVRVVVVPNRLVNFVTS